MKKIVAHAHITLDGFAAGQNGEMDWIKFDDEMFDFVKTLTDQADTALYGRTTWEMMDNYWPAAADKPNAGKHDKEHSAWYNSVEKLVISDSMKGEKKDKTTFIGVIEIEDEIKKIKQKSGKNIQIFGSPSVVQLLMQKNLIDEYWFFINPVILGKGISMFVKMDHKLDLSHNTIKIFSCGVSALHFTSIK